MISPARLLACSAPFVVATACSPTPDHVLVELSPAVISSLDGTTTVTALVLGDLTPLADEDVHLAVTYVDRNGIPHDVPAVDGVTDSRGAFHATVTGLAWDGIGTVAVDLPGTGIASSATFLVLDRTQPAIEILPPTADLRIGPGLPLEVAVHVTDEIGISEVVIEAAGELDRRRTTVIASGTLDATVPFRFDVPAAAMSGPTIRLYALARDLSGNTAAATEVILTVDPAITIATPPGLVGTILTDGTAQALADPRALVVSPRDDAIYVADNAGGAPCNGACIRKVDATTGAIDPTVVVTGLGELEGVAVDATGDNLYFTDRQNRVGRLTWTGTAYAGAVACNLPAAQNPQDPYHLIIDATLGLLSADGGRNQMNRLATCAPTSVGLEFTNGAFDAPRGIAAGPSGELYLSDANRDQIFRVDPVTGADTPFESANLGTPYGLEWLGGASEWANSLLVALSGDQIVAATAGAGARPVTYLRNDPIDVAVVGGTLYILTRPSAGDRGRIYRVTGF